LSGGLPGHLAALIRGHGPLTVAGYMAEALGNPRYGYYTSRDPFGADGDFITAPEVSQMFGEMLGAWCAAVWQIMDRPDPVNLVEFGPGRGTLMADALRAAGRAPGFLAAARIHMIETSALLRAKQQAALGGKDVSWWTRFEEVADGPVLIVANEFFDALPIRQFERQADGWHERLIDVAGETDELRFVLNKLVRSDLTPGTWSDAPIGAVGEVSPAGDAVAEAIGARIARFGGAALIIDYGSAEGSARETLQAVRRHGRHGVLDEPGQADICAHVDFSQVAAAARRGGARVFGPVEQGKFLGAIGIGARADALRKAYPGDAEEIDSALDRLTSAAQMGSLFKVLAITEGGHALPGFEAP